MSGFSTNTNQHLIRSNLWSSQFKDIFEHELIGTKYVKMLNEFPDGDTFNIPSIGQAEAYDFEEGQALQYRAMDTGNYTFTINKYKAAATYISNKYKQDSFYTNALVSSFVPKNARAIAVAMETDILAAGPNGQTSGNTNTINGAYHRFIGSGTNETIAIEDFAKASYALQMSAVPMTQLTAIVHPSVAYKLGTLTNLVNVSNNPRWEGIVNTGYMSSDMTFVANVMGFDVYTSQYLKTNTASETIGGLTAAAGVNNLFFSAAPEALPIMMGVRQAPTVESKYNMDLQREEYATVARWGTALYRPEAQVVVVTDTDQVYA